MTDVEEKKKSRKSQEHFRITIGVLTHNRREQVLRALNSAASPQRDDVELLVVDAASTDGTIAAVEQAYPEARVIRLPRNLGCPGGRNYVFANARGDYILCLDDDGWLGEGTIEGVIKLFDSDETIGVIALNQHFTDDTGQRAATSRDAHVTEAGTFWGGVAAFRSSMLQQIGYYPDDFFLYGEESYLALKTLDAGYRIVLAPHLEMWHPLEGGSGGAASTRWDYYRFRNPLLVTLRLYPGTLMAMYLLLRVMSYFVEAIRRRSVLQYLRAVGYVIATLPQTLLMRRHCSRVAVEKHLRLRHVLSKS